MKKISFFTLLVATAIFMSPFTSSAQNKMKGNEKLYVEAFDDGRVLNQTDIRFFNSISGAGSDSHTTVVMGKKFTAGQKLTNTDAATLNIAKSQYRHKHTLTKADDGKAIDRNHYQSCDWYVYNDGSSNYYVWYCD